MILSSKPLIQLFPWSLSPIPFLRLHLHPSGFVGNSIEDTLLVENDVKSFHGFGLKNLIIKFLHRLPSNFYLFVYKAFHHVVLYKNVSV